MRSLTLTLLLTSTLSLCLVPVHAAGVQGKPLRVLLWTRTLTLDE